MVYTCILFFFFRSLCACGVSCICSNLEMFHLLNSPKHTKPIQTAFLLPKHRRFNQNLSRVYKFVIVRLQQKFYISSNQIFKTKAFFSHSQSRSFKEGKFFAETKVKTSHSLSSTFQCRTVFVCHRNLFSCFGLKIASAFKNSSNYIDIVCGESSSIHRRKNSIAKILCKW